MSAEKKLLDRACAVRRKAYWGYGLSAVLLILTLIYMDILIGHMQLHLFVTRIGLVLMNVAIFVYLAPTGDLLYLWLRPIRKEVTIEDHLQELIKLRQRQQFLYGRLFTIYYSIMMTGLLLCAMEFTVTMWPVHKMIAYAVVCCWLLVFWFRVRPKLVRNHEKKVDTAIAELRRLSEQLPVSS